jgi:hypothetical protein
VNVDPAVLALLTPQERSQLDRLVVATTKVWAPDARNKPQCIGYASDADVIGYGGSAGGGKTDLAIGMSLTKHKVVQFFRREGTELSAIIDRCAELVGHREGLAGRPAVWRDPTPQCRLIEFCSVPHLGDEAAYQGRAKDFLVIDEASNFLEQQVRFLMGWVRSVDPKQKCQTLLTLNPPTNVEGRWVIKFFAPWLDTKHPNPAKSGEVRWFAMVDGAETECDKEPFEHKGETIRPQSRTFVTSRLSDNPYLRDTPYGATLQALPEPLRSQMLHGDFAAGMEDDPWQVIPTAWVEAAMKRWTRPDILQRMCSLGVDVACGGKDNTVLARRHGNWFDVPLVYPGTQTPDGPTTAGLCIAAIRDRAVMHLDLFGVGAKPYGHLMATNQEVIGVNVGDVTSETDETGRLGFVNVRSLLWWRMREALDPSSNRGLCLPPDRRLLADLCAPTWEPQGKKIKVAGREEIRTRIGRSPDFGSAYCLGLMDTPVEDDILSVRLSKSDRDYDMFGDL